MKEQSVGVILERIREHCREIFADNLVGVYVHGLLAFGCFCWENSDIDFIVVTSRPPAPQEKEAFITALLELDAVCPPKGLEMSIVLEKYCRDFVYPTPFELHFSNAHKGGLLLSGEACPGEERRLSAAAEQGGQELLGQELLELPERYVDGQAVREYCAAMHGTDKDLAAHFTVLRRAGFALCGKAAASLFGAVPAADYMDSIWGDIENAQEEILENPVYVILNLCRVLAFAREGLVLSKEQGGAWAKEYFASGSGEAEWSGLVCRAAECCRSGRIFSVQEKDGEALKRFADGMLAQIRVNGRNSR